MHICVVCLINLGIHDVEYTCINMCGMYYMYASTFLTLVKINQGTGHDLFGMRVIQVMYRYMCVYTDFTMII